LPAAGRTKRGLFLPGFWGRIGTRAGIVFLYYLVALPAASFRGVADDIGFPINVHFNAVEAVIFTDAPTHWLQSAFLHHVFLQHTAVYIYGSWFMMPLIATMPLFTSERGRDHWRLFGFLMLTYYAAMPLFALYPLQPPWMHDPDGVSRVIFMLRPELAGRDDNPFAAMPSLHIAMPAAAALWHGWRSRYGRFLFGYTGLIGVTIVFTGDHYVADIVGGYALAGAVYTFVRWSRLPLLARNAPHQRLDARPEPVVTRTPETRAA
jgi:hypothetical protein